MATASGTVASGLVRASATGYFRIASDAHYATDILGGAVIGAAIGVAVPLLFHHDVLTGGAF